MTALNSALNQTSAAMCVRPRGGLRFDVPVALLSLWLVLGLYLDGFAHHNLPESLEIFFTPWHGVLYSGFLTLAGFLLFHQFRNMANGYRWNEALPAGHSLTVLGVPLFFIGGIGDGLWHTLFGIEQGVEALLSPTHLLLAAGGALMVTGPLRSALRRLPIGTKPGWSALLPALLSALYLLSDLTFFSEYANTLASPERVVEQISSNEFGAFAWMALGVVGVLIPSALIVGISLFFIRRWSLPFGSLSIILTGNGLLMVLFHYQDVAAYPQVLIPIIGSGLIADLLYAWLKPSRMRISQTHAIAFLLPFVVFAIFFAVLVSTASIQWAVHMWTGIPMIAGVVGLLVSLATAPVAIEAER